MMGVPTALKTQEAGTALDVNRVRSDFPILGVQVSGKKLVYLDSAASSQMPQQVIDRLTRYHSSEHANIHRGVHFLSEQATNAYEAAREKVQHFINAAHDREVIFTRGTTNAINTVAHGFGRAFVGEGDEIIISHMEHHSNIVPWQMLCEEKGATLKVIPVDDDGRLLIDEYEKLLGDRTRLVAVTHVSNVLGTVNPVKEMIATAHARGVPVLIDGAQGVPHMKVDVQDLDCDFYAFSGHKMCGPTGIGILYGKESMLEKMQPYEGGGDMILSVTLEKTTYNKIPYKFEAGTPPIAAAIGLGTAVDYLESVGLAAIEAHEHSLVAYGNEVLSAIEGVKLYGAVPEKAGVLSFNIAGVHAHDVGTILNDEGVAVRTGHHCAQPLMQRYGVPATARASFYLYNTMEEVDQLAAAIRRVQQIFG
jgi:cysteine desulfurase / selenocysteine lyase